MKIEFNQGVPRECIKWLWENVGKGNVNYSQTASGWVRREGQAGDDWYYERMQYEITDPDLGSGTRHVPTIFIEDEKKAVLFSLRWT
jgi:hypothetical protein